MVKRTTIGKVQLLIGIIILLTGISGIILSYNWYGNVESRLSPGGLEIINFVGLVATIIASSILSIFISLLFILQGLVNISENK